MRWTEYPTRLDYRENRNGRELKGQFLSPAPGGGKWYVSADQKIHLVRTHNDARWSIRDERIG